MEEEKINYGYLKQFLYNYTLPYYTISKELRDLYLKRDLIKELIKQIKLKDDYMVISVLIMQIDGNDLNYQKIYTIKQKLEIYEKIGLEDTIEYINLKQDLENIKQYYKKILKETIMKMKIDGDYVGCLKNRVEMAKTIIKHLQEGSLINEKEQQFLSALCSRKISEENEIRIKELIKYHNKKYNGNQSVDDQCSYLLDLGYEIIPREKLDNETFNIFRREMAILNLYPNINDYLKRLDSEYTDKKIIKNICLNIMIGYQEQILVYQNFIKTKEFYDNIEAKKIIEKEYSDLSRNYLIVRNYFDKIKMNENAKTLSL